MKKPVYLLVACMLILGIFQTTLTSFNYNVEASPSPPDDNINGTQYIEGDWWVNGTESYTNETIVLSGNLIINSGASLTLRNVTLAMNCTTENGTYEINVWGTLDISDYDDDPGTTFDRSNITDSPFDIDDRSGNDYKFAIKVWEFASLSIENTIIREAGFSNSDNNVGFYIERGNNVNIQNCTIENGFFGLYLWRGSNIKVSHTEIRNQIQWGICAPWVQYLELFNNQIYHNDFGLQLWSGNSILANNYIHNNTQYFTPDTDHHGVEWWYGDNLQIYNNTFENNGGSMYATHIEIYGCDNVQMYNNTFTKLKPGSFATVYIGEHSYMNFYNNTIRNNPQTGLRFNFAGTTSNNKYYNNNISNNDGIGVYFDSWGDGSEGVTFQFKNNLLYKNGLGMRLQQLRTYDISNNVIEMCVNDGIYVNDVYGGVFANNSITSGDSDFSITDTYDNQDTVLKVLNCSFDTYKVDLNNNAELEIQNYLHLYVTDATSWVPGAYIEIINATGTVVFTGYTDDNGRIKYIVVKNQTMTINGNTSYDPYNITATLDTFTAYGEIEPVMDMSKFVNVIFSDDLPPTPPSGLTSVSNATNVDLDWVASPSTDIDHYLVYRNATGPGWDLVYNSSLFPGYELHTNWTDPKAASDWSTYHYYVVAVDAAANPSVSTNIAFCGDWVVDTVLGYSGLTVQLNGSLIILSTGNLTLKNVKLQFNNTVDVRYGIEVLPNGRFWILDGDNDPQTTGDMSEISAPFSNSTMYFVMNGDEFVMKNSKLSYCGLNNGIAYGSWTFNVEAPNVMSVGEPWTRGLYIGSPGAAVTIEDNQFTDNFVTVLIDNVNDCTITGNAFSSNTFGLYLNNSHFNLINGNTFTNHLAFPVYLLNSGNHVITYNEFNNTAAIQAGLMLYGGDCLLNDIFYNNFTGDFIGAFIYNGGDDNNISHNYFYDITDGLHIYYTSLTTVMNNIYTDVSGIGIRFQGIGFSSIEGEDMDVMGDGIYIHQCTNLLIANNKVGNATSSGIYVYDSNNIQIRDITVLSCNYGLDISDGFTITIIDITIKDTTTGISCSNNPINLKLFRSTISDNTVTAIEVDTCAEFILTNCTLDATLYNFDLIDAAVILYNTTYNQAKVLLNPSSSITLWWYVQIHVRDWFDNPVSSANVQIRKPLGTLVFNEFTDSNGDTRWFWLLERTQYAFSNETSTPYFIQAFNGTHSGLVEFWLNQSTVVWVILENTAPSVSNAIINPSLPTTVDDLNLGYLYSDPENDPEGSTMILWYTDGIHNTTFNNQTDINSSKTVNGQTWFCEILPHDGAIYGIPMVSTPVSIQNTPPVVENVTIVQTDPTSSDYLNIAYNFSDIDDDFEGQSQYRWHFWDGIGWAYSGVDSLELDPSFTTKGEQWKCVVTPHDGDDLGNPIDSNIVTIGNSAPEVMDVIITPVSPMSNETLNVNYTYFDLDSDTESGSMIKWYMNSTEQVALDNSTSVDASLTQKGEMWYYLITPYDGEDFGIPIQSDPVNIGNTPPTVSNITISPVTPTTEGDLNISYDYSDSDGDSESLDTIVRWLRWNGAEFFDTGLRGKTLPSEHTFKGEVWTCEVIPHDGWNEGIPTLSDMNVTIVNSAPFVINAKILPPNPISISDLLASYQYVDLDFDSQSGSLIRWYLNDVEQTDLNDSLTVSASRILKGEVWYFLVTPSDGEDFGTPVQSENVTIGNTPPSVSNIVISPLTPDTEDILSVSYDFFDIDGDSESLDTVVKWLRWSVSDFFDTGHRGRNLSAEITFKGEIWTCEVIPHDGEGEGLANRSDMNVTIINSAPTILDAEITPANPNSVMDLTASYDYWDVDLDPESGSLIRWYQNDVEQWDLNDSITVSASRTLKGDIWYYIVTPSDGEDTGTPFKSENATIGNTPPTVSNITISPINPNTEDVLTVSYDFSDIDGDSESLDTVIKWLRWSGSNFFDTGHRGRNLSAALTLKGEMWTCEVIPHDGEDEGATNRSDMNVTIINSAPEILSAEISPGNPISVSNLTAMFQYFDVDSDPESGSTISWYRNDIEQVPLAGNFMVDASYTLKGDVWYYIITPSDGENFGTPFQSENSTIGNTPPSISNITISPLTPDTEDVLTVAYDFFDIDGDSESLDTVIKWLRWSVSDFFDTGYRGRNLSAVLTLKGEIWTCEVIPHDGEDEGIATRSDMNVSVVNSPPIILSAQVNPSNPTAASNLSASYVYYDVDGDSESAGWITWYKNDVEQLDLNGSYIVNFSRTQKGDIWYYVITPFDGTDYGPSFKSDNTTIGNTPPTVSNITISPINPNTEDVLTVTYDFNDTDGDSESLDTVVKWLRWSGSDFFDTGHRGKNLSSALTARGEIWTCEVIPHDGLNEGTAIRSTMNVTINNTVPSVLSADVSPSNPTSDSDLDANYVYYDVDSDLESGSSIRWFKDDVEQVDQYGNFTINNSKTTPGEVWYYMITPSDGIGFGTEVESTNVTIGNTPPYVTNITISPLNPDTLDDLTVTYDYYDSDGNNESLDTVVRWLRWDIDKFIDTGLRGKTLSSDYSSRGEIWTCEVVPHDGLNEGTATRSTMNVTINNTVPSVLSADISPASPTSDSDLTASYIYDDMDSDPELGSTIRWLKDGLEQVDQYGNFTINNLKTKPGEIWYYMVTPSDGIGFGTEVKSENVTIGNTPPYVTNITISPLNPDTLDDITVTYDYYDSDGNNESLNTVVRWLRWDVNKFIDTGLRGKTLSSDYTAQGDIWTCEVVPHDGLDEGAATQSDMNVTIGNTEPSILSASISPPDPPSGSNLTADYDFFDVDGDSESGSIIRWYKDDVEQWGLNDSFTVDSLLTQPGEMWHYIITPSDGMEYGTAFVSENVTIGNTPPFASNITISPSNPDTGDDLTVTYDYYDVEGTSESLDTVVRWLRWDIDKFIDTGHRGKTLSSDYTARGETWTCEVIPHDGLDEGAPTRSDMNVTIQNTVPTVLSADISPSSPTADADISASYSYYDVDGDFESGSTISWYQDDVEQLDLYGNFTVNYSRTSKGDIWYYIITPSDGLGFGTPFKSENMTIGNTPPYVNNIIISPVNPTTSDDLTASYDYYDNDGDSESLDTVVKWLRWSGSEFFDTGHRGKTLSSANTAKGEIWTCEVVPHDGGGEGSAISSDMNVTIGNFAPSILGAQIIPANPTAADDLDASYTYYDVDSDAESGSMIAWFRNGIEQTDLNGSLSVNSARTQKGDTWYYVITPSDGEDFGVPVQSDTSIIGNTPPQVSNIAIAPLIPSTGDDLVASYDYFDSDGDPESLDTTVKWLLWSGITFIDTGYRGKTLSSTQTSKGEIWTCEVIPHDGEDEGSATLSSMNVTIANSAPSVSNAVISPTEPTSEEDMTSDYDYTDVDSDTESGSIIQWFRNGIEQVDLLGSASVNFSLTNKGEGWYYIITPFDGEDNGSQVQSGSVIIGNTPPSVVNITIAPLNPTTQDDLTVTYDFYDGDGDSESLDTTVRWLRWSGTDFVDTGFRGKTLSSSQTSKGELWTCEISPHDGVGSGATVTSGIVVTILNSKPTASNLFISPQEPTGGNNLVANYDYYDLDSDPESGSEIKWFRNGVHMPALDNQSLVPNSMTAKGQTWNFSVHPNDNFEFGDWVGSDAVTIQNTPPSAANLSIAPNPPLGDDDLVALYTFTDDDGDAEAGYEIRWFKNVFIQELYSDQLQVDSSVTGKDELWSFTLRVYDGEDWSETFTSHYVVIENSRPIINSVSPSEVTQEISETESLEFFVDAQDPDDDLLIYRWKLGKTTVGSDDYYLFETDYESEGVYTLNLTVQDFGERSYSQFYEWVIIVTNVNRLPELEVTEPLTKTPKMEEDTSLRFLIDETDLDMGDTLDITWYFDDVVAQEGGSSYTYHADFAAAGDHEVRVVVDDGTESTDYSWNLTVADIAQEELLGYSYDWWGLVLAIMSGVVALLLAFIGLMRVKKKKGALKKYMTEIDELTKNTDLSPEEYEERLSDIEARINDEFKQGLIEDLHYLMLQDLVASKRGEARKAEVASMFGRLPAGVVSDLDNMLKDGKITPEEYEGFVATISMTESLTPDEKEELSKVIEKWEVEDGDVTSDDSQSVKDKIIKDELDKEIDALENGD